MSKLLISFLAWEVYDWLAHMAISSYMLALKTIKIVHLCVVLRNGKLPYDNMDNLLSLSREGGITSSRKGIVDNLSMTYDGNMLASVSDSAPAPSVTGSADFRGGMSGNAGAHPVEGGVSVAGGSLEIGGETGGMELARPGASQPYRFLGNELYTSNSLGLYDFSARMYDPALGRFLSVDPMAERYSRVIPYGYCGGNPIRLVDQSGYDWRDKVAGFLIGTATNIIPASSWRDAYNPNDIYDYNAGLQVADNVLKATGGAMVAIGIAAQTFGTSGEVGGLVASTSVVGAPGGLVIAGAGAATVAVGDATALFGSYMMSNVSQNEKDGYLRGKNASSSREARREAMRQEGIPTSQQPTSQSRNASGREYRYEIETSWGKKIKSVQQQTMDSSHPGQQHWEAGDVKMKDGQIRYNKYDRPRLVNSKSKVDY